MRLIKLIIRVLGLMMNFISGLYFVRPVYSVIGFFTTRRFKEEAKKHKYAVLVAARNEEAVISHLIDSIHAQDYPGGLVDIFVVADNCTDNTAQIARDCGAICYERFDNERRTKGYALQYLIKNIDADYGIKSYEGYFIFDADNLLKKDFITRMNESFDSGEKIITSYRNTKNFDDNWISASYGIHWMRTIRLEHRARSLLHLATRVQGTGYLFAAELIEDGWKYTGFTEDRALCADAVVNGYKISFNDRAEFYDEQPTSISIAMRQRIRWSKGHIQAIQETGWALLRSIFVTKGAGNRHLENSEGSKLKRLYNNLRHRFMSFDMFTIVLPYGFATFAYKALLFILNTVLILLSLDNFTSKLAPSALKFVFEYLHIDVTTDKALAAVLMFVLFTIAAYIISYATCIISAVYVLFMERRRIGKIKWYKKAWYAITFPIFDLIGQIAMLVALVSKVEWKPIPHNVSSTIEDINAKMQK